MRSIEFVNFTNRLWLDYIWVVFQLLLSMILRIWRNHCIIETSMEDRILWWLEWDIQNSNHLMVCEIDEHYKFRIEYWKFHSNKNNKHTGIFFREGESWHEQRRFALRYLRDFGFGRRFDTFEKEIEIQIKQFIDMVKCGPKYDFEKVCTKVLMIKLRIQTKIRK